MSEQTKVKSVEKVVVRFSGDSGDGMQLAGNIFSNISAAIGNEISTFPDYPAEIRAPQGTLGGVSGFQVHIGNGVYTPGDKADVLVAMNLPSLQKFVDAVVPGGKIIIDSTLIDIKVERTDVEVFYVPATQMAKDAGYATLANMILAGKVLKEIDAVAWEGNKETLEAFIPAKKANLIDVNCQALQLGYDY